MKWKNPTNKMQVDVKIRGRRMKIERLLTYIYAALLHFYPAAFRTIFFDEMLDNFSVMLHHSADFLGLVVVVGRELCDLPLNICQAHWQIYKQLSQPLRRRKRIQWVVRIFGGLIIYLLISILSLILTPFYNVYAEAVPFVIALVLATVSMIIALYWGRVGGLLTIASGAAIGCCMTLYLYVMAVTQIGVVATVLIGFIWALPFLIFGILFYELSKPPKQRIIPV